VISVHSLKTSTISGADSDIDVPADYPHRALVIQVVLELATKNVPDFKPVLSGLTQGADQWFSPFGHSALAYSRRAVSRALRSVLALGVRCPSPMASRAALKASRVHGLALQNATVPLVLTVVVFMLTPFSNGRCRDAYDGRPQLKHKTVPVLFIIGEDDEVIDVIVELPAI